MTDLESLTPTALRERRTVKWTTYPEDVLPLWIAEMDYPTAPPVVEAVREAVRREGFGYPLDARASGLGEAYAEDAHARYAWEVDPRRVHLVGDVMQGIELAIGAFSGPHDPVVLTTPVYMPFFDVVAKTGRPQRHVPLAASDGRAELDLAGIDAALAEGARTVLLCSPYNPLGLAFSREELLGLADVVSRHGARVVADEIHAPLVLGGTHLPYASLSEETAAHTVTVVSASKAWNLPGLKCAQVVTSNEADERVWRGIPRFWTIGVSTLGIEANLAAYRHGQPWLDEVLGLLGRHADLVAEAVDAMPGVRTRRNEATYLAWLDCTELGLDVEPAAWFLEQARVALSPGLPFRAPAKRFARLNFATTTAILEEALDRMAAAVRAR